jgi:hypothetical protein
LCSGTALSVATAAAPSAANATPSSSTCNLLQPGQGDDPRRAVERGMRQGVEPVGSAVRPSGAGAARAGCNDKTRR